MTTDLIMRVNVRRTTTTGIQRMLLYDLNVCSTILVLGNSSVKESRRWYMFMAKQCLPFLGTRSQCTCLFVSLFDERSAASLSSGWLLANRTPTHDVGAAIH